MPKWGLIAEIWQDVLKHGPQLLQDLMKSLGRWQNSSSFLCSTPKWRGKRAFKIDCHQAWRAWEPPESRKPAHVRLLWTVGVRWYVLLNPRLIRKLKKKRHCGNDYRPSPASGPPVSTFNASSLETFGNTSSRYLRTFYGAEVSKSMG